MLLLQEIKKVVKSIPYLIFVAAVVIGLFSQGVFRFQDDLLEEPQPGGSYGYKHEEIAEQIMPAALRDLLTEFSNNNYTTYPIGFIKHVKITEGKQERMAEILSEITGSDKDRILQEVAGITPGGSDNYTFQIGGDGMQQDGNGGFTIGADEKQQSSPEKMTFAVRDDMDYSRFKELMGQADDLLGGGSNYAVDSLIGYGTVPLTYEEAKERYDLAVSSDQVTGGYARLFSDYAGVMVLSILPVFLAVILSMKDRRAKMEALIYTKETSAVKLTFIRYLAQHGIQIAAIAPGAINTPMNATDFTENNGQMAQWVADETPAKRWASPDEVANLTLFLASPQASYMSGAIVPIDGGWTIK